MDLAGLEDEGQEGEGAAEGGPDEEEAKGTGADLEEEVYTGHQKHQTTKLFLHFLCQEPHMTQLHTTYHLAEDSGGTINRLGLFCCFFKLLLTLFWQNPALLHRNKKKN